MAEYQHGQPRALAPRRLEQQESLSSLNQWTATFKNYYRRCQIYGYFLTPGLTWTPDGTRGFSTNEATGLKRTPEILASDLDGLLQCIAGYTPFDYVFEKLQAETTSLQSAWDILYEIYDVEVNTTHFLDYATMAKEPQETYRGYFNRLVGFVRQHLPRAKFEAEGVKCSDRGESLTIGLLDAVTLHWLNSVDKRLVKIVKTEFATELKVKRICQMVKTIAPNIDDLLLRYNVQETSEVSHLSTTRPQAHSMATSETTSVDMILRRLERLETGSQNRRFRRMIKNKQSGPQFQQRLFCGHCNLINKQLGANLNTSHSPYSCTRKQLSVNVIDTMDNVVPDDDTDQTDAEEGETSLQKSHLQIQTLQIPMNDNSTQDQNTHPVESKTSACDHQSCDNCAMKFMISESLLKNKENTVNCQLSQTQKAATQPGIHMVKDTLRPADFSALIQSLKTSTYDWQQIQKSKSPQLRVSLQEFQASALVDSGAEINVIDEQFAKTASLGINPTSEKAQAANKLPLNIKGQTREEVILKCPTSEGHKMINLGIVLVVHQLGVACLIGQPGIEENNIISLPRKKIFILAGGESVQHAPYYSPQK